MSQPVTKVPVEETNSYNQGKGMDAAAEVKVGPAYRGGALKDNPTPGDGVNRALKSNGNQSV
jgi:hypothetical protein